MIFDRLRVDAVLAGPIICRSRRSALVFFADRCTSPLRSFSLLRSWLAVSTTPSSAALNRSQRILFWLFKLPFGNTFTFLFSSSMKLHLLHSAIPQMSSNSSMKSPGSCAFRSFLQARNSFDMAGKTASSRESHDSQRSRLSVSIWISS